MLHRCRICRRFSRPSNPASTSDELVHQLSVTRAKLIITHPICLTTARKAAKVVGLPDNCIVLIRNDKSIPTGTPTLDDIIKFGSGKRENYREIDLKTGEAKTSVAFF